MPAQESSITMDTKVIYNKGGKRNGYLPDTFDRPPDWESNEYSDEDEVFVESPSMDISSATKPLMYPRTRTKFRGRVSRMRCRPIVHAVVCFLFLVLSLGSLMGLVVYFVNKHNKQKGATTTNTISQTATNFRYINLKPDVDYSDIIGCDHVEVEDVWVMGFPKLLTESAFRLIDVNSDGTLDVILGFATGTILLFLGLDSRLFFYDQCLCEIVEKYYSTAFANVNSHIFFFFFTNPRQRFHCTISSLLHSSQF